MAAPESYAYDAEGNRTASHLSAAHTTDIANRLTEDDAACYAYDANGNLTTKTAKLAGACTGGVTSYTWDAQDQLTRIDFADLSFAAYRYDGLGRRIEKDVDGALTRYVYDGSDILLEFDGTNTLLARISHGQGTDQPLAVERGGQAFFYHADHRGSVRAITDAGGLVVNAYAYDAYGNIEASFEGIANPYTFTGREFDAESGLYYYRARYYDPATGKFLGEDPLGFAAGDFNLSRYVFNNPVNLTDPGGEIIPQLIAGCALGAALDAGIQLAGNGGRLGCLDFGEVAGACVAGGVGAVLGPAAGRLIFGRVARAVRGAEAAGSVQGRVFERAVSAAERRAIEKSNVVQSLSGKTFFSNSVSTSVKKAFRRLALGGRRGPLPEFKVRFRVLNNPRVVGPRTVQPARTSQGEVLQGTGGGREFFTIDRIEVEILKITPLRR